jgi:hypothetical protein
MLEWCALLVQETALLKQYRSTLSKKREAYRVNAVVLFGVGCYRSRLLFRDYSHIQITNENSVKNTPEIANIGYDTDDRRCILADNFFHCIEQFDTAGNHDGN